jgi:phospholipase C
MRIPNPDPGELWIDINMQLFGAQSPAPTATATMEGFVRNYVSQTAESATNYVAKNIMHYFAPEQVPVISTLAREFAVCDRWFASAPCQTWPNRFFVHTGMWSASGCARCGGVARGPLLMAADAQAGRRRRCFRWR